MVSSRKLSISNTELKKHEEIGNILDLAKTRTAKLDLILPQYYDNYASMSAYLYPDAPASRVIDITVFFNILYFVDEVYGEDSSNLDSVPDSKSLLSIWLDADLDKDIPYLKKIESGMHTLKKKMIHNSNLKFITKLENTLKAHLKHVAEPFDYRTVDEYIKSRVYFSGMELSIDMIEYAYDEYTDKFDFEITKRLKKLKWLCSEIGALSNDIFSYPKEKHSRFNLVNAILFATDIGSIEESITEGIVLVNKKHTEFKLLTNQLKNKYNRNTALINYLMRLEDIISGSYHWQINTGRYLSKEHFIEELIKSE